MQHRTFRGVSAAAFLLAAAAACSGDRTPTSPATAPVPSYQLNPGGLEERSALAELTRAVALALADQGLRQRIKNDMRAAPFHEHKLELRSYLNGGSGGILLAKMAKETGRSRAEIQALLGAVRPLEFYMPVRSQRETWLGGSNLWVGSLIEDEDVPLVFDLQGQRVPVGASEVPAVPTLALVPAETDFAKPLDARKARNVNDQSGGAIGTFMLPIDEGGGGGGGGGVYMPPGLYMTFSRVLDNGEASLKGAPELEVHIHGPTDQSNTKYGADLSCAGEQSPGYRYYNQDDAFFERSIGGGAPLLFTQSEIDNFNSQFPDGFDILMWEDDDTACQLKTDKNITQLIINSVVASAAAGAASRVAKANPWVTAGVMVAAFLANTFQNANWLLSNDDYVGAILVTKGSNYEYTYPGNTHVLMNGGSLNGRVTLQANY